MQQQINFYRAEFRREQRAFGANTMISACGAIALAMLLGYAFAAQKMSGIETELQIVNQQELAAIDRLEQLRPIVDAAAGERTWADRLDDATRTLEEKQLVLSLVQGSTLGDTLGFSRYLRSLARQDFEGLWLTRISLSALGNRNRLEGKALRAELVATYLQSLAAEPPFAKQRFHQFQIDGPEDGSGVVTFAMNSDDHLIAGSVEAR